MLKHILIVDDHAMMRRGIANTITNELPQCNAICDEATGWEDALKKAAETGYDLVILDISMPGMNGIELMSRLKVNLPAAAFLVVSMHAEELYGLKVLRAGADGYITKSQVADELLIAVDRVLRGERYLSRNLADLLIGGNHGDEPETGKDSDSRLSRRERQIMELLAEGVLPKVVAADLGINSKTVSTYKKRIFTKMGFKTDAELILYVSRQSEQSQKQANSYAM
jgi:DNA-binding NarL/FixJ family response regulator